MATTEAGDNVGSPENEPIITTPGTTPTGPVTLPDGRVVDADTYAQMVAAVSQPHGRVAGQPATSEMGMWIEEMYRRGMITGDPYAQNNVVPTTPATTTTTTPTTPEGAAAAGWIQDEKGRWIDPGTPLTNMSLEELQAAVTELQKPGAMMIGSPFESPLLQRRGEILRNLRRYDPYAAFQAQYQQYGGADGGGGQGPLQGYGLSFDPTAFTRAPTDAPATSPALRAFLESGLYTNDQRVGGSTDSPEYDAILQRIRQYDPNAKWVFQPGSGGGGDAGLTSPDYTYLDYDRSKLPVSEAERRGWQIVPVTDSSRMFRPDMTYYDPLYGRVTDRRNMKQSPVEWWTIAAPILITMVAPYAAPALFSALGGATMAAGFTSAVTAAAAGGVTGAMAAADAAALASTVSAGHGLAADAVTAGETATYGALDGAAGAYDANGIWQGAQQPWWMRPITPGSVRTVGQGISSLTQAAPTAPPPVDTTRPVTTVPRPVTTTPAPVTTTVTTDPTQTRVRTPESTMPAPVTTPATTNTKMYTPQSYAPVAKNGVLNDPYGSPKQQGITTKRSTGYDMYGYDPTAFNSSGSAAKPASGDTKLVATQFADDPYRFS